jgi:hypothetical protein
MKFKVAEFGAYLKTTSIDAGYHKRKGHPATGRPSLSRENSSNGALNSVKTFWSKSYEPKKRGVKQFSGK